MSFFSVFRSRLKAALTTGPLSSWNPGAVGVVETISAHSQLDARLRELGVVPGVCVRLLRGGCPLVFQVEDTRLCLRQKDAACIKVRPL